MQTIPSATGRAEQTKATLDQAGMPVDHEFIRALAIAKEASIAGCAVKTLEAHRICLAVNSDPLGALETAHSQVFDVVIFDVNLLGPGIGAPFRAFRAIPNLSLVALLPDDDAWVRVRWLEAGSDECLSVPCSPAEFVARVRATVRCAHRAHFRRNRSIQVGRLSMSLETMHAEIDGQWLELTAYEFALLWALARNSGKVLTREQLLGLAKGSAEEFVDRSIDVQVSRLRSKLGDNPRHPRFLKTVRGAGYLLVPDTWDD